MNLMMYYLDPKLRSVRQHSSSVVGKGYDKGYKED